MSQPSPRPFPEVRFIAPDEMPEAGASVWLYEGMLERITQAGKRYRYRQRVAWPQPPAWEPVRDLGLWMVERLSINGHLLMGLRAREESNPPEASRLIAPPETP